MNISKLSIVLVFCLLGEFVFSQQQILFKNVDDSQIYYYNLNTSQTPKAITETGDFEDIKAFAVDFINDYVYVSSGNPGFEKIYGMNIDGSDIDQLTADYHTTNIEINNNPQKLFWTEITDKKVYMSDYAFDDVSVLTESHTNLSTIAVDAKYQKIYFSDSQSSETFRVNFDATGEEIVFSGYAPLQIKVNSINDLLYWINPQDQKIYTSTKSGTDIKAITDAFSSITSFDIDPIGKYLYICDTGESQIFRTDFDGQNKTSVVDGINANNIIVEKQKKELILTSIPEIIYYTGQELEIQIQAKDAFDTDNRFYVELSDENGSFDSPTTIGMNSGTSFAQLDAKIPFGMNAGKAYRMRVRTTNPEVYSNISIEFEIKINVIPQITSPPVIDAHQDEIYCYMINTVDDNIDNLHYSTSQLPDWLELIQENLNMVSTLAGSGTDGYVNGTGSDARFSAPKGVAIDRSQNIYIADFANHAIRKITPEGVVTTYAGTGNKGWVDGVANESKFRFPSGLAVDNDGNVFVADYLNHCIRKISTNGMVSTFAGDGVSGYVNGRSMNSRFNSPSDIVIDSEDNLYIVDSENNQIRKITKEGDVSTFAGSAISGDKDGKRSQARFKTPLGIAIDGNDNLYVADNGNNKIRKITKDGEVTTIAGNGNSGYTDGEAGNTEFKNPVSIAVDVFGDVYVADSYNHVIRKISEGQVSTILGENTNGFVDGKPADARFTFPYGLAFNDKMDLYIVDYGNYSIRKYDLPMAKLTGTPVKYDVGEQDVEITVTDGIASVSQSYTLKIQGKTPSMAASNIQFSDVQTNSMRVSWTNGDGASRIVIARAGESVTWQPTNGVGLSGANSDFQQAANLGQNNMLVYKGDENSFIISGLVPNQTYYFAVYEYNGEGGYSKYKQDNPAQASYSTFSIEIGVFGNTRYFISATDGSEISIPFSVRGSFASNNRFTAYLSDASGNFTNTTTIGEMAGVNSGEIQGLIPAGLDPSSNYRIKVISNSPYVESDISAPIEIIKQIFTNISSKDNYATQLEIFEVDVTFSESIEGFDQTDVVLQNAAIVSFTEKISGEKWTIGLKHFIEGETTVRIPKGVVSSQDGAFNEASNEFSILFDQTNPNVEIKSDENVITGKEKFNVKFSFNELVNDFDVTDIVLSNCTIEDFAVDTEKMIWTANVVPISSGFVSLSIVENAATDMAGNKSNASETFEILFDNNKPQVEIAAEIETATNQSVFEADIIFSKQVLGFEDSDIQLTNVTLKGMTQKQEKQVWTCTFEITNEEFSISIPGGVAKDIAGNLNTASAPFSGKYDITAPTITITTDQENPTANRIFDIIIAFSEPVINFSKSQIELSNANVITETELDDNKKWKIQIEAAGRNIEISVPENSVTDISGNGNQASNTLALIYDSEKPTVTISSTSESPTNQNQLIFDIEFSSEVTGFNQEAIGIENAEIDVFEPIEENKKWQITVIPTNNGTINVFIPEGAAEDIAGNANIASEIFNIIYDNTPPVLTISSTVNGTTNLSIVPVKFTFNEEVNDFNKALINITNGTITDFTETISGLEYTANIILSGDTLKLEMGANAVADLAGNENTQTSTLQVVTDHQQPTATVIPESESISTESFKVFVEFSEEVEGFSGSDLFIENCFYKNEIELIEGLKWEIDLMVTGNPIKVGLKENTVIDLAGNLNIGTEIIELYFDNTNPNVTLTYLGTAPTIGTFYFKAEFSEPVIEPELNDFTLINAIATSIKKESETLFYIEFVPQANSTVVIKLEEDKVTDLAGNGNNASVPIQNTYQSDTKAPSVQLISNVSGVISTPFAVTFVFDEDITDFLKSDISLTNASIIDFYNDNNFSFTAFIQPHIDGLVTVSLPANVVSDLSGNGNIKSEEFSITYGNTCPTAMTISEDVLYENTPIGTTVGELHTVDPTPNDTFTYSIVPGDGYNDRDNKKFIIEGNELKVNSEINFEAPLYDARVHIQVQDNEGCKYKRAFMINIMDENEPPVLYNPLVDKKININETFDYHIPDNTFIDEDSNESLTYKATLVSGMAIPSWLSFDSNNRNFFAIGRSVDTLEIKITVTDKGGLSASDIFTLRVHDPSGIEDLMETGLSVFPNPAIDFINIKLSGIKVNETTISLMDITGKVILQKEINVNNTKIDISTFNKGVYLLKLQQDGQSLIKKIIKQANN